MDRKTAKQIMDEVKAATDKIFEAHGMDPAAISASFGYGEVKVTVKGAERGESSPKVADWKRYAESYGLPKDALGKTVIVTVKGVKDAYTITGLAASRSKYPVCVKSQTTGKDILLTADGTLRALGLTGPAY